MQINSYLVKKLGLSHLQIQQEIAQGHVFIDNELANQKQFISEINTVIYKNEVLKQGTALFYFAYHKPVGVESTMNLNIENNLVIASKIDSKFFPVGRLDKASEGLMILTNDGALYKEIIAVKSQVDKTYEVVVDKEIDEVFIQKMSEGIDIMGAKTKPCIVVKINAQQFKIVLREGRNRQIRRMCYKLGYKVLQLKRIAIGKLKLELLIAGETIKIERNEII